MLEGLACVAMALVVSALGFALVDRGERRSLLGRDDELRSQPPAPPLPDRVEGYAPLLLEPSSLQWPSEVSPATKARSRSLPWPSETWDDNWKTVGDPLEARQQTAVAASEARAEAARQAPRPPPAPPQPAPRRAPVQAPLSPRRNRNAPAAPSGHRSAAIPAAEIRELVEEIGLAAAVEEVRKRTGSDFQSAAKLLAAALRDG